jgi:hypothetical protein
MTVFFKDQSDSEISDCKLKFYIYLVRPCKFTGSQTEKRRSLTGLLFPREIPEFFYHTREHIASRTA